MSVRDSKLQLGQVYRSEVPGQGKSQGESPELGMVWKWARTGAGGEPVTGVQADYREHIEASASPLCRLMGTQRWGGLKFSI